MSLRPDVPGGEDLVNTPRVTITLDSSPPQRQSNIVPDALATTHVYALASGKARKRRGLFSRGSAQVRIVVPENEDGSEKPPSAAELRRQQVAECQTRWNDIHRARTLFACNPSVVDPSSIA